MTMKPNFALVKFSDDQSKKIVKVSDIYNFSPRTTIDFVKNKVYKILWPCEEDFENLKIYNRGLYKAVILVLAVKWEEINEIKRYTCLPQNLLETASESEGDKILQEIQVQTKEMPSGDKENANELYNILRRRTEPQANVSQNIKGAHNTSFSDSSDCEEKMVPLDDYHRQENQLMSARKKLKTYEIIIKERDNEISLLQNKNERLTEINLELQFGLLNDIRKLKDASRNESARADSDLSKPKTTLLGNMEVCTETLNLIENGSRNSIYVKELAVLIFGKSTLMERSVSGNACPRYKDSPESPKFTALSPNKLKIIRDCYEKRLKSQGNQGSLMSNELKNVNRYIAEKIQDLRKSKRRLDLANPEILGMAKKNNDDEVEGALELEVNEPEIPQ